METVDFSGFWGWHTLIFGVACWILTMFVRRIVETAAPSLKKPASGVYTSKMAMWWNDVILFIMPVVWAVIAALVATMYPFPEGMQSTSARILFGIVVGFFSGFLYKVLKKVLAKHYGVELPESSGKPSE